LSAVTVTYEIPMGLVRAEIVEQLKHIEAGLNDAVDELLDLAANTQILKYSASAFPAPPPSSTYSRTYTLQGASETRRTSTRLPVISGEWSANEAKAKHAKYVLGKRAQQAKIHRGRWKSTEEVEREIKQAAPAIVQRNLR
jgi:hypothetical protein